MPVLAAIRRAPTVTAMLANEPSQLPLVFRHHLNAGEVQGLLDDYYAPDAAYSPIPGVVVRGDDLRRAVERLVALDAPIEVTVRHVVVSDEQTALIVLDWTINGAGIAGTATDVARRQPDGTWKCVIDNPHGAARIEQLETPPQTQAALAG